MNNDYQNYEKNYLKNDNKYDYDDNQNGFSTTLPRDMYEENQFYNNEEEKKRPYRREKELGNNIHQGDKINQNNTYNNSYNSYNINNISTNIKMGKSSFNDTLNNKNSPSRLNYKNNIEHDENNIMTSLNVNNLIESDLIDIKSNNFDYYKDNENNKYDGSMMLANYEQKAQDMTMDVIDEYNNNYIEKESNKGNASIDNINKNINCINNDVDNINSNINNINDNIHKINSNVYGNDMSRNYANNSNEKNVKINKKNESSLNTIDNLVNKNMQSINHFSSLMQSSKHNKMSPNKGKLNVATDKNGSNEKK